MYSNRRDIYLTLLYKNSLEYRSTNSIDIEEFFYRLVSATVKTCNAP
jgi:hypothetical protein